MNPQIAGLEALGGTYVFDIQTSNATLNLNRFFWNMRRADMRESFLADPAKAMQEAGLTEIERGLVQGLDWIGLIRHGANFFAMEKFARLVKTPNLVVYASMRGESFEDFMRTRRVPEMR
jgi:protocatechuate 4,5-dioxygenase alpha chain